MKSVVSNTLLFVFFVASQMWGQTTTCPSLDIFEILNDPVVQNALDEAWRDSQEGTPNEHEEGGWIVHELIEGSSNPCQEYRTRIYRWPPGVSDEIIASQRPSGDNLRIVADFHTHPGPENDPNFVNHVPSLSDLQNSADDKIPGIIRYGSGLTSANTHDIIFDGSYMIEYNLRRLRQGIETELAGFYDSRIASRSQMENAGYRALEPEWECEEVGGLPEGEEEYQEAYKTSTGISANPMQHKDRPLQFDYRLDARIISPSALTVECFVNSADGSVGIFEEQIENITSALGDIASDEDLKMHYVVLGTNQGGLSKVGYYGEAKDMFEGAPPLVGMSVVAPSPPAVDCMIGRLTKTGESTNFNGEAFPWYSMEVTSDGETVEVFLAMKPTLMTAKASDFRSLVGILKDPVGQQNYLVVEYRADELHIILRQIERLARYRQMDLRDYTVLTELNTSTNAQRFDEQDDMQAVMAVVQEAYEGFEECVKRYRGTETESEIQDCWNLHLKPLRKEYPHLIPPFEY